MDGARPRKTIAVSALPDFSKAQSGFHLGPSQTARLRRAEHCICDTTITVFDKNLARARFQRTLRNSWPASTCCRANRGLFGAQIPI